MTDKVLTCANAPTASDLKAAIFARYRADQLAQRHTTELDIDVSGRVLNPQVTTAYVDAPPPKFADPMNPTAKELSDYAASKQVQVVVDATVEAMQGAKVDIGGGKQVTIDVSTAVIQQASQSLQKA